MIPSVRTTNLLLGNDKRIIGSKYVIVSLFVLLSKPCHVLRTLTPVFHLEKSLQPHASFDFMDVCNTIYYRL